ncbi:MAG TPA: glycosyltransferase family 2 protein [Gemmatimonadales bacterium]|nr:glycosyltransferase family 2 protein [Gemmatimonadales bacterium]
MGVVTAGVAALSLVLLLPTLSDLWSLLALARPAPKRHSSHRPRILALVPAHNEALLIQDAVRSLLAQKYPRDRWHVLVIADNCTDDTAARARAAGAECLERVDLEHRGKPHAIAWAMQQLPLQHLDAITVIDADVVVAPDFASGLALEAPLNDKAVQPYNDVRNPGESALTRMSAVFAAARFRASFLLKQRVGLSIPLSAGLCLGTEVLARYGWDAFSLCEDWELYASLTARGIPVGLARDAHLYAQETKSLRQSGRQRRRWMLGKWAVLAAWGGRLLASKRTSLHQTLDAVGELISPGPALHLSLVVAAWTVAGFAGVGPDAALLALTASLVRPAVYAGIGIARDPEPRRAARAFGFLPFYAAWRLVGALGAILTASSARWERTERHAELKRPA